MFDSVAFPTCCMLDRWRNWRLALLLAGPKIIVSSLKAPLSDVHQPSSDHVAALEHQPYVAHQPSVTGGHAPAVQVERLEASAQARAFSAKLHAQSGNEWEFQRFFAGLGESYNVPQKMGAVRFAVRVLGEQTFWGPYDVDFLKRQPGYVSNEEFADVVFAVQGKFTWRFRYPSFFNELEERSPEKPWVVFAHNLKFEKCGAGILEAQCEIARVFINRRDILFVSYDLRDHSVIDDEVKALRGVTFPPFGMPRRGTPPLSNLTRPPRYLLTFRGDGNGGWFGSSSARPDLRSAFAEYSDPRVAIEFATDRCPLCGYTAWEKERYDELLMDSSFALVPHGDGRWEARLSEVVGACAVPVIMADGLTLPFEELIDWSSASIRVNESLAREPASLLAQLPTDPDEIVRMRLRVCEINRKYFATNATKFHGLLVALRSRKRLHKDPGVLKCPPPTARISGDTSYQQDDSEDLRTVHVVYATNARGFIGLLHSMTSVARNLGDLADAVIHVIVPSEDVAQAEGVVGCFHRDLEGLIEARVSVELHEMQRMPSLPNSQKYAPEAFIRLYLQEYMDHIPRVLWLDIDTIVRTDVTQLFRMRMQHTIASALDGGLDGLRTMSRFWKNTASAVHVGLMNVTESDWLNTGVLLFDLKRWKENSLTQSVVSAIESVDGWSADQLGISLALRSDVDILDWRWNQRGLADDRLPEECAKEAKILHWTGYTGGKPWEEGHFPLNDRYYRTYGPRRHCAALLNEGGAGAEREGDEGRRVITFHKATSGI